jgi:hypothetical protein
MGVALIWRGVSAAVLLFTLALFGAPLAGASPTVTGQKYSDASSALSSAGFKVAVASTVGDRLRWSDCVVSAQRDKSSAQQGNHGTAGTTVEVTLNCDAQPASATTPGYSAGSPDGRAAKAAAAAQG